MQFRPCERRVIGLLHACVTYVRLCDWAIVRVDMRGNRADLPGCWAGVNPFLSISSELHSACNAMGTTSTFSIRKRFPFLFFFSVCSVWWVSMTFPIARCDQTSEWLRVTHTIKCLFVVVANRRTKNVIGPWDQAGQIPFGSSACILHTSMLVYCISAVTIGADWQFPRSKSKMKNKKNP